MKATVGVWYCSWSGLVVRQTIVVGSGSKLAVSCFKTVGVGLNCEKNQI